MKIKDKALLVRGVFNNKIVIVPAVEIATLRAFSEYEGKQYPMKIQ